MADEWNPLEIIDRKVTGPDRGLITLRLKLSAKPDPDWAAWFSNNSGNREGSMGFLMGPPPQVVGDTIEWVIPERDMEGAFRAVKLGMGSANARFPAVLALRRELAKSLAEQSAAAHTAHEELQKKLDSL